MFDIWSDGSVLSVVEDSHRQVAVAMARSLAGIFELLERRTAEELEIDADVRSMITGFRRTAVEVGAVLNMSSAKARVLVRQADALHTRLPAVGALLAAGEVDWATTELVLSRTDVVDEEWMAQLDAKLAEEIRGWACWSRKNVINAIDVEVDALDSEAVKKRRVRAFDERAVTVEVGLDGIAEVRATMTAEEGAALDTRLTALAKTVCAADPRSLRARRADAFTAIQKGRVFACACESKDCPSRAAAEPNPEPNASTPGAPASVPLPPAPEPRVVLNVIASAETVAGHSDAPGYLAGYGVIDAALVRELARDATRRLVEVPAFDERQALTYRPSAALARFIRARDLTYRFPGCIVPAERCDIDHTTPFDHDDPSGGGWTVPWNLACYCREHHRHKTFDEGWRDEQLSDGTIIWTSPSGATLPTKPGGVAMFPGLAKPRPASVCTVTATPVTTTGTATVPPKRRSGNDAGATTSAASMCSSRATGSTTNRTIGAPSRGSSPTRSKPNHSNPAGNHHHYSPSTGTSRHPSRARQSRARRGRHRCTRRGAEGGAADRGSPRSRG